MLGAPNQEKLVLVAEIIVAIFVRLGDQQEGVAENKSRRKNKNSPYRVWLSLPLAAPYP